MLVPIRWLKSYADVDAPLDVFCERMIMSGSNIETVEVFAKEIEGVVVGRILSVKRHPNADRLLVAQVDVGAGEPVQICTGAMNIFEGALVPVALDGSRVPGPLHGKEKVEGGEIILAGELRGLVSNGMMCNCTELGFSDKVVPVKHREGIWILEGDWEPGTGIVDALALDEAVVDFEITPNRPDCLSMIGMAREASAVFGTPLIYPETDCKAPSPEETSDHIHISVDNGELCKRYVGRVVKDIRIAQSPWWLQHRLITAGMRPINNIVDITNYVMLEYGQPIHAFDLRHIRGGQIRVGNASEGERFATLDGQERTLSADMLMIRDAEGPIAIAGVMGGLDSEIREDTAAVLIESANFLGDSVRTTSKKLGLRTEASSRFEKGLDPGLAREACDRVCYLIEMLKAGTVLSGAADVYPAPARPHPCEIRPARISRMLGVDIGASQIETYLNALEMKTERLESTIRVTPPGVRMDLLEEVDYVEEVARMYGYDRLPLTLPRSHVEAVRTPNQMIRDRMKNALTGLGVNEIQTYSFVSPKTVDRIGLGPQDPARRFIKLINPLGEDTSVMRTVLLPNMLEVLARNMSRSIEGMRAYELGNTFGVSPDPGQQLPDEKDALCAAVYGGTESFFTLKGILTESLRALGIDGLEFGADSEAASYHPGRCAGIFYRGQRIGTMGQIHPAVADTFGLSQTVYAAELFFQDLYSRIGGDAKYAPLPKYPAMKRDFAMVVEEQIRVGDLEKEIRAHGGELLEEVKLFDIYRGNQVPKGSKSVAFSLTYRAKDRTLKEAEVSQINTRVLVALKEAHHAVLREM